MEATHRSVEEIITRISDPSLDSSLEDIAAMVAASEGALESPAARKRGALELPLGAECRVSPEFTKAVDLIDKVCVLQNRTGERYGAAWRPEMEFLNVIFSLGINSSRFVWFSTLVLPFYKRLFMIDSSFLVSQIFCVDCRVWFSVSKN